MAFDRLIASTFGVRAVELLAEGLSGRMVAWRAGTISDVPLTEVVGGPRFVTADSPLMRTARQLGIYIGDGVRQR